MLAKISRGLHVAALYWGYPVAAELFSIPFNNTAQNLAPNQGNERPETESRLTSSAIHEPLTDSYLPPYGIDLV